MELHYKSILTSMKHALEDHLMEFIHVFHMLFRTTVQIIFHFPEHLESKGLHWAYEILFKDKKAFRF